MLVLFSTDEAADIAKVGGKAASLISLQQGGAKVPAGFVLTSEYFASWLDRVEACEAWREALSILTDTGVRRPDLATRTRLADVCDRVKDIARGFDFTAEQRSLLGTVDTLGSGPYAGRRAEILEQWRTDVAALARCPNVVAKLDGINMPTN